MGTVASQITSLTVVYSTVDSGADQIKHQSFASLAFVHKWPVTRKMFPFDDVIMIYLHFLSFINIKMVQVAEILHCEGQGPIYPA